jgi:two-component system, sensor histidine kinase RegB
MAESFTERSAAAMGIATADDARPWYLSATPLATLPWLIRLRWTTAAIEAAVVVTAVVFRELDFPLRQLAPLILAAALTNIAIAVWLSRVRPLPRPLAFVTLTLDIALLTGLLDLTGGPFNPFSVVLIAHVMLATLTLGKVPGALIGGFAAAAIGLLLYWHTRELDPEHHRLNDFPTHLFTMWIAIAATAELAAYFVVQASNALARREAELEAMRQRAARSERLISLTTLAAGAAHELSTPLATIALASRELQRAAESRGTVPDLAEDARLIRAEVDRCQTILDQMTGRAGGTAADDPESIDLASLVAEVRAGITSGDSARLDVRLPATQTPVFLPRGGLRQALLSLVKNACDATRETGARVVVDVAQESDRLSVTVRDPGPGMPADVLERAGEPFFTTKEPGKGLGLGLFLARIFAERVGGRLVVTSDRGTTARLEVPSRSAAAALETAS